jgi:hypothetical protein
MNQFNKVQIENFFISHKFRTMVILMARKEDFESEKENGFWNNVDTAFNGHVNISI